MSDIYHDPTRGWLLLTTDGQIEIDEDDWVEIRKKSKFAFKDHHAYSVDAEFEVKMQKRKVNTSQWIDMKEGERDTVLMNYAYRQIARLVKAKEKVNYVEAFKELRESNLGDAWDKIKCPCDYLGRDKCDLNCPEYGLNPLIQ